MFRTPSKHDRIVIIGKTGTGKTIAGLWHLSLFDDSIPWVLFDYKLDSHIASLNLPQWNGNVKRLDGFQVIHPLPGDDVQPLLWSLWQRGNVGIFIDESYMMPNCDAMNAILTQGRSKSIPVIACTQRPVFLPRFYFSEADFVQIFWLNDLRDRKTVESLLPSPIERLPKYESTYYDVARDEVTVLSRCPPLAQIRADIAATLDNPQSVQDDSHNRRVKLV